MAIALVNNLKVHGSISAIPVNKYFKRMFEQTYPGTKIDTEIKFQGSNEGTKALCDGKIDIAASSKPLESPEFCKGLKTIKIGLDAVVIIIVKKDNTSANLTTEEVQKIFRCEDPKWFVIYGSDQSGTKNVFEQEILNNNLGNCKSNPPNFKEWTKDEYTQRIGFMVKNSQQSITYAPYTYAVDQRSIKMLTINGLTPDNSNYPYQRPLYYVYRVDQQGNTPAKVKTFLGFVGSLIPPNSN